MIRAFAALFFVLAALALAPGCRSEGVPDFYGVRLGMTASDVRDRFTATGGTFKADVAADDYSIRWTPGADANVRAKDGGSNPLTVDFAFHMGTLVAIEARVPDDAAVAKGPAYVVTKSSVLRRAKGGPSGVEVDVFARDCPAHKAKAEAIVAESNASP